MTRASDQKVGILLNCRMASTRLPGKALLPICGRESVALLIDRLKQVATTDLIVLCTTLAADDDPLVALARREKIESFRGSSERVAERLLLAGRAFGLEHFVRVTGDDILRDPELIDGAVRSHLATQADYTYLTGVVYGGEAEVIRLSALETVATRAAVPENTEYLTWYLDQESHFRQNRLQAPAQYNRPYHLSLDDSQDYELLTRIHEALYRAPQPVSLAAALRYLDENPDLVRNQKSVQARVSRESKDTSLRN